MSTGLSDQVGAVRHFNRFYTKQIGVLGEDYLIHGLSLTEGRVLFEIAHHANTTAADVRIELDLDRGHLSRLLARLEERGLLRRQTSTNDRRRQEVQLTAKGRRLFATLDQRAAVAVGEMLHNLPEDGRQRLVAALRDVRHLLTVDDGPRTPTIRPATLGDLPWVFDRHITLYADEYGWGSHFAGDVARTLGDIAEADNDPRQQGWVVESDDGRLGSVWCVADDDRTARLRLLIMEPAARGSGLGTNLVETCVDFARASGYDRIVLFTQSVLVAARHLYANARFTVSTTHPDKSYGPGSIGETWSRTL